MFTKKGKITFGNPKRTGQPAVPCTVDFEGSEGKGVTPPTVDGTYNLQVASGAASFVAVEPAPVIPAFPTIDGTYVLSVVDGVATFVVMPVEEPDEEPVE